MGAGLPGEEQDKAECLAETDQLQGVEGHVQLFMPAGVDFMPARRAGQGHAHGTLPR